MKALLGSTWLRSIWNKEAFFPTYAIGIWINPYFIIRRGLARGVSEISRYLVGGRLLDVGCGSKPYEKLFDVQEYIGIDIETSGHDHASSKIDRFYDGKVIPFSDEYFDNIFSSEVLEHVFNVDELLAEMNRVLKGGGKLGFTCPFVWDEHEQPYDFARYTSFAIEHLLDRHGFRLLKMQKSTGYIETVLQMLSAYLWQNVAPKNVYLKLAFLPSVIAPVNILGVVLGRVLPKSGDFYHNNIVIAEKISGPRQ